MSHSERLVHTWLLGPGNGEWLDLDPRTRLLIRPSQLDQWTNYPSTMIGLRARQGLLVRQYRAHMSTGGRCRSATAQQQDLLQWEQARCYACRSFHEHTPRIELRQHAADNKHYYHVHGQVGFPLVLPASDLGHMEDPIRAAMRAGEMLLPVAINTSERLQELSYEYTLEVAASSETEEEDEATCSICLDSLSSKVRVLACKHQFHPECIDTWCLQQENDDKTCPCCRQVLWG